MQEEDKDRLFVTALARGLAVLSAFKPGETALSNQELAKRTGLPKSTVSRLSYTLLQLGYLQQDGDSGFYRLGLAVLALGSSVLASYDIRSMAAPLMREFALTHNISVSLALRNGTDMVYLETCRSQARIGVQLTIGSRVPLATSAIGRACYAGLADNERKALDDELALRYGQDWPATQQALAAARTHYLDKGFCESFGEYDEDVMAVAIPLPPLAGSSSGLSLNASGPRFAWSAKSMHEEIAPALSVLRGRLLPGI
ncbi:IclR family transcriptional regulator [Craterilacuibacter sp.]|uniref:IclR family transcriptional regulator n=1 Tax=Craterilacuibacter sp. TaxID=2870909 RepID=UPI003F35ED79